MKATNDNQDTRVRMSLQEIITQLALIRVMDICMEEA